MSYAGLHSGMVLGEAAQAWYQFSSEAFCQPCWMSSPLSLLPEQMRQPTAFSYSLITSCHSRRALMWTSVFAILKPSRVGEGSTQPLPLCNALRLALSWSRIKPQLSSCIWGQKNYTGPQKEHCRLQSGERGALQASFSLFLHAALPVCLESWLGYAVQLQRLP